MRDDKARKARDDSFTGPTETDIREFLWEEIELREEIEVDSTPPTFLSRFLGKVLKPNDYTTLEELANAIHAFGRRYSALGKLFAWCFTRQGLERCLREPVLQPDTLALATVAA